MKIGVFGCTADPFTCAHYEIVKKVLADKLVDKVIVIPTIVNYYRSSKDRLFSNEERLIILNEWFAGEKNVYIDDYEYLFAKYRSENDIKDRRYISMLTDLKHRYEDDIFGHEYKIKWFTIIGNDSFRNFKTWYNWRDILELSELIVVNRYQKDECGGPLDIHEIPVHIGEKYWNISATNIRNRLLNTIFGMSMGPKTTCLDIYIEEVKEYKRTGKTNEELKKDVKMLIDKAISEWIDKKSLTAAVDYITKNTNKKCKKLDLSTSEKLWQIQKWLMDPYKDDDCKYSLIEDMVSGKI